MWPALECLLLTLGAVLVAIEVLVIPGFGATGVVGGLMLTGGVAVGWTQVSGVGNVLSVVTALAALVATAKIAPRFVSKQSLVLESSRGDAVAVPAELASLVGWGGTALTPLHPCGTARIGERTVDVVSVGMYVEAGQLVHVVRVEGARVVVEPTEHRS